MIEMNRIWRSLAEEPGEAGLTFTECGCLHLTETEAGVKKYEDLLEIPASISCAGRS